MAQAVRYFLDQEERVRSEVIVFHALSKWMLPMRALHSQGPWCCRWLYECFPKAAGRLLSAARIQMQLLFLRP